jgi:chromosome segregation ATPase
MVNMEEAVEDALAIAVGSGADAGEFRAIAKALQDHLEAQDFEVANAQGELEEAKRRLRMAETRLTEVERNELALHATVDLLVKKLDLKEHMDRELAERISTHAARGGLTFLRPELVKP